MKLRNYQQWLIDDLRRATLTHKRPIAVLPCGAGKTFIFTFIARQHVLQGGKVHFYVHRRELLDQTYDTFKEANIPTDNIYIQTIQTRKKPPFEPTMIIFDEAHHAVSATWKRIIDNNPDAYIIGLTATPKRTDGQSLGQVFDTIIEGVDADWLIDNNYLAPYDYYAPVLSTLSRHDIYIERGRDYDGVAVGDVMLRSKIYGDVKKYLDPNRKTIIYSPSIAFSESLTDLGVVHLDGNTPDKERRQIISDFKSGKIMWLSNVDLLGEGFDVPDCEVVILLRPTKSTVLFIQQTMRALRYKKGKQATIYDLVGNVYTHGMPTDYNNWVMEGSMRPKLNQADETVIRVCQDCFRAYKGIHPICPYCNFNNGKTQAQIREDKEAELKRIKEIKRRERIAEEWQASTLDELIQLGVRRGYKSPRIWATKKWNARIRKRGRI